ncbi:hypothetical protein evm_015287 [Chilo suppressalis]|nr:hypothetical protein evm_015287 [Chilo suppressalis]
MVLADISQLGCLPRPLSLFKCKFTKRFPILVLGFKVGCRILAIHIRPKRFTLKAYKRGWVSCRDGVLRIHSSREAAAKGEAPSYSVELRGAEVTPDAHPASGRYSIKLEVPSEDAMHEMWLKCENEDSYAVWVVSEGSGVHVLLALHH